MKKYILKKLIFWFEEVKKEKHKIILNQIRKIPGCTIHQSIQMDTSSTIDLRGSIKSVTIAENVVVSKRCIILIFPGAAIDIGPNVFFNNCCSINCLGKITIGPNTIFGEAVKLYDHNHKFSFDNKVLNFERNEFAIGSIVIGKNCWIGSNVTILNNVVIGDNVIIGANCLIYQSVPANSIVKAKMEVTINGSTGTV